VGLEYIVIFIVGLLAGGFVNVLADDLPLRRSIRTPRYVPDAKKRAIHVFDEDQTEVLAAPEEKRPVIAWLGLLAFLTGNRTSPEGVKLSWRYPLTELLTALLMVLTLYALQTNENLSEIGVLQAVFWFVYMVIFVTIIVIDIEHKLILFAVIIPSCLLALLDSLLGTVVFEESFFQPSLRDALIGGAFGFVVFFILYNGGFIFTYVMGILRGEKITEIAFGYGDVMMATLSGLILGWRALIFSMFITVFLGAFGALIYIVSRRFLGSKYSAFTALPYGPYIVIGTIVMLLYRVPVTDFLMNR